MLIKRLHGHSRCDILLLKIDNRLMVRKISASRDYNERLRKQKEKQQNFKSSWFKTPRVYCFNNTGEKHSFDMHFINGKTFNNFMEHADQKLIFEKFTKMFNFVSQNNYIDETIESQMVEKIDRMQLAPQYSIYGDYCLDFDWFQIKKSYCHGDLTFENIMISDDEIYFIDFLDSFVDSRIVDYSKMLQDILLGWSWRYKKTKPYIKLICMHEYMVENMSSNEYEASKRMLVLNMLRALPYANTQTVGLIDSNLQFMKSEFIDE